MNWIQIFCEFRIGCQLFTRVTEKSFNNDMLIFLADTKSKQVYLILLFIYFSLLSYSFTHLTNIYWKPSVYPVASEGLAAGWERECVVQAIGERWAPAWLGESWILPTHPLSPCSLFISSNLFLLFVRCSHAHFYLRHLLFLEWPANPLQACWQQWEIQPEPDFSTHLVPVFCVQATHPVFFATPANWLPAHHTTYICGFICATCRICPFPGSSWAIWGSLFNFFLLLPAFQASLLILVACSPARVEGKSFRKWGVY